MSDVTTGSQALPGFEEMLPTQGVHDSRRRTVINLYYSDRAKYNAIIDALSRGEDVKKIAIDLNVAPVALRDFMDLVIEGSVCEGIAKSATAAAVFYKNRYRLIARKTHSKVLSEIASRNLDEMTISELIAVHKYLSSLDGVDVTKSENSSRHNQGHEPEIIDYDALINGLDSEKIRAPRLGADDGQDGQTDPAAECSTGNTSTHSGSFQQSDNDAKTLANDGALCNALCKHGERGEQTDETCARPPAAPSSAEAPQGAGGTPGASRAGGVN